MFKNCKQRWNLLFFLLQINTLNVLLEGVRFVHRNIQRHWDFSNHLFLNVDRDLLDFILDNRFEAKLHRQLNQGYLHLFLKFFALHFNLHRHSLKLLIFLFNLLFQLDYSLLQLLSELWLLGEMCDFPHVLSDHILLLL